MIPESICLQCPVALPEEQKELKKHASNGEKTNWVQKVAKYRSTQTLLNIWGIEIFANCGSGHTMQWQPFLSIMWKMNLLIHFESHSICCFDSALPLENVFYCLVVSWHGAEDQLPDGSACLLVPNITGSPTFVTFDTSDAQNLTKLGLLAEPDTAAVPR